MKGCGKARRATGMKIFSLERIGIVQGAVRFPATTQNTVSKV